MYFWCCFQMTQKKHRSGFVVRVQSCFVLYPSCAHTCVHNLAGITINELRTDVLSVEGSGETMSLRISGGQEGQPWARPDSVERTLSIAMLKRSERLRSI